MFYLIKPRAKEKNSRANKSIASCRGSCLPVFEKDYLSAGVFHPLERGFSLESGFYQCLADLRAVGERLFVLRERVCRTWPLRFLCFLCPRYPADVAVSCQLRKIFNLLRLPSNLNLPESVKSWQSLLQLASIPAFACRVFHWNDQQAGSEEAWQGR